MSKKIVISFPGIRGCEIPMLYFGAKHFEDMGYEKVFINNPVTDDMTLDTVFKNACEVLENMNWDEYERVVFVAKSLGTVVACKIKERFQIPASLVLFTPLEDTLKYITKENDILLVAMGDKDKYLSSERLVNHCEQENIKYYIEAGVGHRMEVTNDLQRNLEIISNVIGRIET